MIYSNIQKQILQKLLTKYESSKTYNGENSVSEEDSITDLHSLSDVVLCRLAGFTLEKLMQSEM